MKEYAKTTNKNYIIEEDDLSNFDPRDHTRSLTEGRKPPDPNEFFGIKKKKGIASNNTKKLDKFNPPFDPEDRLKSMEGGGEWSEGEAALFSIIFFVGGVVAFLILASAFVGE